MLSRLFVLLQYLLPQHGLSRLMAWFARARLGRTVLIRAFIKRYGVDMSESVISNIDEFDSFNSFFTRQLRPGCRPLATGPDAIISPADGSISQLGLIDDDRLLQAKGRYFTLVELLGGDQEYAQRFRGGSFATVYLSPRDYHRVHMPLAGTLVSMTYVPGKLFSVNQATTEHVAGLFARNERVVCLFDTEVGTMAVILVGAMIVAGIETAWCGQVCPTHSPRNISRVEYQRDQTTAITLTAGAEMGRFMLGSTAIVLFQAGAVELDPALQANSPVRMGQLLATRRSEPAIPT